MKNIKVILINLFILINFGCEKSWDNHFGYEEDERCAAASMTILETLESMSKDYSRFIDMINRAGYSDALNSERMLTIWAPTNDMIPDDVFALEGPDLKRFVKNHMNSLALFKTKLTGRRSVTTLAGKVLALELEYNGNRYLDGILIEGYDVACKNGVIHQMGGVMKPLKNLGEYLAEVGDEFSTYRDTLYARNDTLFRPDLSFPIGVNEVGQTIYDSVFDIKNTLLVELDLSDEAEEYTLCLPSNAVIDDALKVMKEYMDGIKRPFSKDDTITCMQWLMRASVLRYKEENYTDRWRFHSAYGSEIRPEKQIVHTKYNDCSNGIVYNFESIYFPRSLFMTNIETWPLYFASQSEEVRDTFLITDASIFEERKVQGSPFLYVGGKSGNYMEFNPIMLDKMANPVKVKLLPGTYAVYGQWCGYNTANTKITINGEVQQFHKNGSQTFPTGTNAEFEFQTYPLMIDTLVVPVHVGYHSPAIRIEALSGAPFAIKRLRFTAVGNNNY